MSVQQEKLLRNKEGIRKLVFEKNYSIREVARFMHLNTTTVSSFLKRIYPVEFSTLTTEFDGKQVIDWAKVHRKRWIHKKDKMTQKIIKEMEQKCLKK